MKKSMCCSEDMIYLGIGRGPIFQFLKPLYLYCCSKCGNIEWSTNKEKAKYKWYKCDKERLKELLRVKE